MNPQEWHRTAVLHGKVRSIIELPHHYKALVVSDRISAFDQVFGEIKGKGQILNQLAVWWFKRMPADIPHHFVASPHPQITIVKAADVIPLEIIVRGYLTGTTPTSAWHHYQHNHRQICGLTMPAGMQKNQPFATPIITPTTKPALGSNAHDLPISAAQIVAQGIVAAPQWQRLAEYAMQLFNWGQQLAARRGLILADTKYEMGVDVDGKLMFIDEIHTPDSSRYWLASSYSALLTQGKDPENLDKDFFRKMVIAQGGSPEQLQQNLAAWMTPALQQQCYEKYSKLYEIITGDKFFYDPAPLDLATALAEYL